MKKTRRPTKLDRIATDTATYHSHASTADIQRQHIMLSCESNVVEAEIVGLMAKLAEARMRRAVVEAKLQGLAYVVGTR